MRHDPDPWQVAVPGRAVSLRSVTPQAVVGAQARVAKRQSRVAVYRFGGTRAAASELGCPIRDRTAPDRGATMRSATAAANATPTTAP